MAQNYTQTTYTQTTYTQAVVARRNADAILTIAPFAAAISVSPAPLSNFEKLEGSPRGHAPQRLGAHARELGARGRDHDDRATCGSPAGGPGRSATADRSAGNRACADQYS
jgi:hypothetical protein